MDAKLFFVLVELARIMMAFFLRESPSKTYPAPIDQGNLIEEVIGTLIRRHDFQNSFALITVGSFTADGGLL